MSAPPEGTVHLLIADDDLPHPYGGFVAVCGEVMNRSSLPPSVLSTRGVRPPVLPGMRARSRSLERWAGDRALEFRPAGVSSSAARPPDASAQAGQDDDSQPRGHFLGEYGHRVPLVGAGSYVGPCDDCDPSPT